VIVPEPFFRDLLPAITDVYELRVTLLLFWALQQHHGSPRAVAESELRRTVESLELMSGEELDRALSSVAQHGAFICAISAEDERHYLLNTPSERRALAARASTLREIPLAAVPIERNVFQLYEENVGPLTPMVAEELRDAERHYPFPWLEDAFREAVALNRRNWRYIRRILERWAQEGRESEEVDGAAPRRTRSRFDHLIRR
jgi:DnaD/phage-associated family protein